MALQILYLCQGKPLKKPGELSSYNNPLFLQEVSQVQKESFDTVTRTTAFMQTKIDAIQPL